MTAHVFDFGVVTFLHELPLDRGTTPQVVVTPICDALYDSKELDAHATTLRSTVSRK